MIKITVGNNVKRVTVFEDETKTPRQVLEENEINYTSGVTTLDGAPMQHGDMDKSFADLGITEKCYLLCVVKADNA